MAKLNLFATTSNLGFLKCLKAPEGCSIVGNDINSLEPHVLAHFSQDPGYMRIYRKGANPNCIYLYLGAHSNTHGPLFRSVYDPDNSTKDMVSEAKKLYGDERQVYKVCVLALAYEGTEAALERKFKQLKIPYKEGSLTSLVSLFKNTFAGLQDFKFALQHEWRVNNGYILSGRGMPLAIPRNKINRDVIAYFCQRTGHDYVMRWVYHMNNFRIQHKIQTRPYIPDFHDASYWVTPDDQVEKVKEMFQYGYDRLNDELDLTVEFKGESKVAKSMIIK